MPRPPQKVTVVPSAAKAARPATVTDAKTRKLRIAFLAETLKLAKDDYYNSGVGADRRVLHYANGQPFKRLSDAVYDRYEDELRLLDPKNAILKQVGSGAMPVGVKRVKLPAFMGSLTKIKADGTAKRWIDTAQGPFVFSDKKDGVSVLIVNVGKRAAGVPGGAQFATYRMYTRGRGDEGFDVSVLLPYLKGIGRLGPGQMVRGELIIPNKSFAANHAVDYENARNLVSAIVNSAGKTGRVHAAAKSATFIVHGMVKPAERIDVAGPKLQKLGWKIVPYRVVSNIGLGQNFKGDIETKLTDYLRSRKAASGFMLDGVVLTDANGESKAFKGNDEEANVEVASVTWNATRFGYLKPVANFVTGVRLEGVTVVKATAHNARMIQQWGIGPGAVITVVRSGAVIPKIVAVVKKAKPQFPPRGVFEWITNQKGEQVDIQLVKGNTHEGDAALVASARLTNFLMAMGIEGVKGAQCAKLVASGIDNPIRLVKATQTKLLASGIGPSATQNLLTNLPAALARVSHLDMMVGSGIFPRGWGYERLSKILDVMSYGKLVELAQGSAENFKAALIHVEGFQTRLLMQLQDALKRYNTWITRLGWRPRVSYAAPTVVAGPLNGTNIVFTKVRSKDAEARIADLGGKVGNSVNAQTKYVVAPLGEASGKITAAQSKGIPIITLDQLNKILAKL